MNPTVPADKLEPEGLDKATPLKVFRTPNRVVRTRRASGTSIAKLDQDGVDTETGRLIHFIGRYFVKLNIPFILLKIKMNQVQIQMLVQSIDLVAALAFAIRALLPDA